VTISGFNRNFEASLEEFGWPMKTKTAVPSPEATEKFHKTIRNLIIVSSCSSDTKTDGGTAGKPFILSDFPATFHPIKVSFIPVSKLFRQENKIV